MAKINLLDEVTIDNIAAGEVVDKPLNAVKELVENSIDSGADSVTVEIKNGGKSLIRVTDNGSGIEKSEIRKAFLRHATSKISGREDLFNIMSLGFRGEALSSICAVSYVECITKTSDSLTGIRYVIDGGKEIEFEEIGAPNGTTFLVRNLFYNVPARLKFLKSDITEAGYISDMMEHLALSHPEISFRLIINGKEQFQTSGNSNLEEVIYRIYGKEVKNRLLDFNFEDENCKVMGFIGKPEVSNSTRRCESFFINSRFVNCKILTNAVEEGYKNFMMQHKFPFVVLHLTVNPTDIDVNVHPSKMEVRLDNGMAIYDHLVVAIRDRLKAVELIPSVVLTPNQESMDKNSDISAKVSTPEVFETKRISLLEKVKKQTEESEDIEKEITDEIINDKVNKTIISEPPICEAKEKPVQLNLFEEEFLKPESKDKYTVLGQIFKTYWLITFEDKLFIMDQHAAHEKINYERLVKKTRNKDVTSQNLNPPIVVELTGRQYAVVKEYEKHFEDLGFEIEEFGIQSIAIRAIPTELYGWDELGFFTEVLDEIIENPLKGDYSIVLDKLASMACKAAVKGNMKMSFMEVEALLDELMTLDNPYNCPHGRPTIISMSKYEIEKKFKRIVN